MVDHRHAVTGSQETRIFNLFRPVGINYHKQGSRIRHDHGVMRAEEAVTVIRFLFNQIQQRFRRVVVLIQNHVGLRPEFPGETADADIGAKCIQIGKLVAHDKDLGRIPDQFRKCIRHHAGLDFRSALNLQAAASEELKADPVFDDRLISSAGKRKFGSDIRKLKALLQCGCVFPEPDTDAGRDPGRILHLMQLFEDGEFIGAHTLQILLLKNDKIAVAVIAAQDPVILFAPVMKMVFHRIPKIILDALRIVPDQLIQVIDHDDSGYRAGVFIENAGVLIIRDIQPVCDAHYRIGFFFFFRTDEIAVKLILSSLDLGKDRIQRFPFHQPFPGKIRDQGYHLRSQSGVLLVKHVKERVISPDHTGIGKPEHRHRQREAEQRAVLGVFRVVGDGFDVFYKLSGLSALRNQGDCQQDQKHNAFRRGKGLLTEKQRCGGKKRNANQKQNLSFPRRRLISFI